MNQVFIGTQQSAQWFSLANHESHSRGHPFKEYDMNTNVSSKYSTARECRSLRTFTDASSQIVDNTGRAAETQRPPALPKQRAAALKVRCSYSRSTEVSSERCKQKYLVRSIGERKRLTDFKTEPKPLSLSEAPNTLALQSSIRPSRREAGLQLQTGRCRLHDVMA